LQEAKRNGGDDPPLSNEAYVPIGEQELILRGDSREIALLVANDNLSLTDASRAAGERVTDPHVHQHTEAAAEPACRCEHESCLAATA